MIRALLFFGAIATAFALLQSWRLSQAETRLDAAEAKVAAYTEAAQIRAKQDADLAQLRRTAAEVDTYLSTAGGGDVPLSDYLSDAARKLWP